MGRKSERELEVALRSLVGNWQDCSLLAASVFARHPVVVVMAESRYPGLGMLSRGLVLRDLIRDCLEDLVRALHGDVRLRMMVEGALHGQTQRQIARTLNVSEEWVSRRYKPVLVGILLDALQSRLRDVRNASANNAA